MQFPRPTPGGSEPQAPPARPSCCVPDLETGLGYHDPLPGTEGSSLICHGARTSHGEHSNENFHGRIPTVSTEPVTFRSSLPGAAGLTVTHYFVIPSPRACPEEGARSWCRPGRTRGPSSLCGPESGQQPTFPEQRASTVGRPRQWGSMPATLLWGTYCSHIYSGGEAGARGGWAAPWASQSRAGGLSLSL